ncbi:DUF2690 domain-containing protein [Streptomyces sp. NPDC050848]|uniref:helix-turn-helix domain-containing protein n=1 Tax=Streptomyces sp. NPDC050848 TaxID=3155791 RepID=UPI0034103E8C
MPRWQALPDELDPRVREFAGRLRRLVDRSGLSVAAVADRTGYSRTSWERYLEGRVLAPRGAVLALAEVTGTDPVRLTAEWERAERASKGSGQGPRDAAEVAAAADVPPGANASTETSVSSSHSTTGSPGADAGAGAGAGSTPTRRPTPPPAPTRAPAPVPPRRPAALRALLLLTGILGALLVVTAAVLLADLGGSGGDGGTDGRGEAVTRTPTTSPGSGQSATPLPAGVKCSGAGCTGQDPEVMGCGGTFATTVSRTPIGVAGQLEVRFSSTCGAAWARITGASPGDILRVTGAGSSQNVTVGADPDAYSPMVAVTDGTDATACATPTDGARTCTGGR